MITALQKILVKTTDSETKSGVEEYAFFNKKLINIIIQIQIQIQIHIC